MVNNSTQSDKGTPPTEKLWGTDEVMAYTGWGRTVISRLCTGGVIPYIPGKPHKFIPSEVKDAIRRMQQYGKRHAQEENLMKSTVTTCPFTQTEALADIAGEGMTDREKEIEKTLQTLKASHPEIAETIDRLDDLFLAAINASQNNTLRKLICPTCNTRTVCNLPKQEPQC